MQDRYEKEVREKDKTLYCNKMIWDCKHGLYKGADMYDPVKDDIDRYLCQLNLCGGCKHQIHAYKYRTRPARVFVGLVILALLYNVVCYFIT